MHLSNSSAQPKAGPTSWADALTQAISGITNSRVLQAAGLSLTRITYLPELCATPSVFQRYFLLGELLLFRSGELDSADKKALELLTQTPNSLVQVYAREDAQVWMGYYDSNNHQLTQQWYRAAIRRASPKIQIPEAQLCSMLYELMKHTRDHHFGGKLCFVLHQSAAGYRFAYRENGAGILASTSANELWQQGSTDEAILARFLWGPPDHLGAPESSIQALLADSHIPLTLFDGGRQIEWRSRPGKLTLTERTGVEAYGLMYFADVRTAQ